MSKCCRAAPRRNYTRSLGNYKWTDHALIISCKLANYISQRPRKFSPLKCSYSAYMRYLEWKIYTPCRSNYGLHSPKPLVDPTKDQHSQYHKPRLSAPSQHSSNLFQIRESISCIFYCKTNIVYTAGFSSFFAGEDDPLPFGKIQYFVWYFKKSSTASFTIILFGRISQVSLEN